MRNGQVAGIVAAAAVLTLLVFRVPLVPLFAARLIGQHDRFWLEFALECAAVVLIAGVVLRSQEQLASTPALWAWGALLILLAGGMVQGANLVRMERGIDLQDGYFVLVDMRFATRWGAWFCLFAGFYALFPKATGLAYSHPLARLQLALTLAGFAVTMGASWAMGLNGKPQRYADFVDNAVRLTQAMTVGGYLMMAGTAVFLAVLGQALLRRRRIVV